MPRRGFRNLRIFVVLILAAALFGFAGYTFYRARMAAPPTIALDKPFSRVGSRTPLTLRVEGGRYGIVSVRVSVTQGPNETPLFSGNYQPPRPQALVNWTPSEESRLSLIEGTGHLHVEVRGPGWFVLKGRSATLDQDFVAVLKPPRLELLTSQHYVNQGGCELLAFRVDPPDAEGGVVLGDHFFKGYPLPGATNPGIHFAIFALSYDLTPHSPIRLRARDSVLNENLTNVPAKVFPKGFRERRIDLDDAFIEKVDSEIMSHTPSFHDHGDSLANFLAINGELRRSNNEFLAGLAERSTPRFLWTEPFKQLMNSEVEAHFADHRTYVYKGKTVDHQDHLGYDLATTAHARVSAANDGVCLFADFLGIYGNTIVLDHGYGLLSLYGHLSAIDVAVGAPVKRGDLIGHSGSTGLAGGDHLHFSMILQGVQVDPKEWWDPHWIRDRITSKLAEFSGKEPPAPPPPSPPAHRKRRAHPR